MASNYFHCRGIPSTILQEKGITVGPSSRVGWNQGQHIRWTHRREQGGMEKGDACVQVGSVHGGDGSSSILGLGGRKGLVRKVLCPEASSGRVVTSQNWVTMMGDGDGISSEICSASMITQEANGEKRVGGKIWKNLGGRLKGRVLMWVQTMVLPSGRWTDMLGEMGRTLVRGVSVVM